MKIQRAAACFPVSVFTLLLILTCDNGNGVNLVNNGTRVEEEGGRKEIIITGVYTAGDSANPASVSPGTDAVVLISEDGSSIIALGGGRVTDDHSLSVLLEHPVSHLPWKISGEYYMETHIIMAGDDCIGGGKDGVPDDPDDNEENIVYGYKYTNGGCLSNMEKYNLSNKVSTIDFDKFRFFQKKPASQFQPGP
ncbi:MAG: hypothetical protein LBG42_01495 [Treponema sp.]|jgi:hypothetical protein|nr:hypothetical protein [Treponema sp.]